MKLLLGFAEELETTMVVVTHDMRLAQRCSRQLRMDSGRISEEAA